MPFRHAMILLIVLGISCSLAAVGSSLPASRYDKSANLNGIPLKFAATHFPPHNILTLMPNGNYTDIGSTPLYFAWLAEKLNFTISYDYLPNEITKSQYGNLGDIALVLKVVQDKKFDGSSRFIIASSERMKTTDFAIFMWAESLAMVVPLPGEEHRIFAFVHPFQSTVWLLIFIAGFIMVVLMALFSEIYCKFFLSPETSVCIARKCTINGWFTYYLMYIINTMTNQGNAISLRRLSFRILVGVWVLVATVLVNSYSGTVISYLTIPNMKPPINTFEDLVASEDVELIILADTMTKKQILEATRGAQKILGDDIRAHPDRILNSIEEATVRLKTERYAFGNSQSFSNSFIASQFQENGKCRFKTSDPYSMTMFYSMPLQKDSKYTPIFKYALMELWETGLPEYWVKNSMPRAPKCFEKTKLRRTAIPKPIGLDDLAGAFFILGVGVGLATFFFLVENMIRFISLAKSTATQKQ
ncbi:ionotropic receptor 93a-like [Daphnia pulicaria]|uniref:ionotropic receptor 93a-like n=1 Tax=Daphnia pulicaria TaxID=35523 RepID=UPI001EEC5D09|nr:ionotropic receptor 93a-like [Daphnia pulicaria]XP_046635995.1 ionotropic receptor 93a-like [Daphnia pulicaria]